jgi:hypothetical protein
VVCLDEFEQLVEEPYREQFPERLYDCWRALMSGSQVAFVTVSQRSLEELAAQKQLTSPFFNVFTTVPLGEFTDLEARALVNRGRTCDQPFSNADCEAVLRMGGRHPYKLQLAGSLVYEHKAQGQQVDLEAVQQEYQRQIDFIFGHRPAWWRSMLVCVWGGLRWLVLSPRHIGRLARFIGFSLDDLLNWIVGVLVLVLVALVLWSVITVEGLEFWLDLVDVLRKWLKGFLQREG